MDRIRRLIAAAKDRNIHVASHDDTPEKVETLHGLGVGISEFPINLESAQAARERGMRTVRPEPPKNHNNVALEAIAAIRPQRAWLTHIGHELDAWLQDRGHALPPGVFVAHDGEVVQASALP